MNRLNHCLSRRAAIGLVLAAAAVLAFAPGFLPRATAAIFTKDSAVGTWQAKKPSLTLAMKREGNELQGFVLFGPVRNDGSGPKVAKRELALVDTRFHGDWMTFGLDVKNRIIQYEVRFLNDSEAEFRRFAGEEPPVKLLKRK